MSLTFHWFLPTMGDSRNLVAGGHGVDLGRAAGDRPASLGYLTQIARAAEQLGFVGALTPTGAWCDDAWLTTAMLAGTSERLKFLVAFRPGLLSPTLAAQMAATFQRHSGNRLLLNVVTGGESREQRTYGDFLDKDARYERTDEFLEVVTGLWRGETLSLDGKHIQVADATLNRLPDPVPDVYFGGSSPKAGLVAAKHADVYLTWGEKPEQVAATPRSRPGPRPIGCSRASTRPRSPAFRKGWRRASRRASAGWPSCTVVAGPVPRSATWRSRRTSGRGSGSSGAGQAPRWSAAIPRLPTGSSS